MRSLRRVGAGLWAAVGLLLGHDLAYRVLYRDAEARAHALEHSGHGWAGLLGPLAVLFLAGAAAATVVDAMRSRRTLSQVGRTRAFAVQAGFQMGAFVLLEVGERLAHGWSFEQLQHDLFGHHGPLLLVVGIAIQLLCAAGAALLVAGIEALVTRRRGARTGGATSATGVRGVDALFDVWSGSSVHGRAPPSALANGPICTAAPFSC